MNANTQIMNFCGRYFDDPKLQYTKTVLNYCPNVNLREAQQTKGAVILHETAHTNYAMRDGPAYVLPADLLPSLPSPPPFPSHGLSKTLVPFDADTMMLQGRRCRLRLYGLH